MSINSATRTRERSSSRRVASVWSKPVTIMAAGFHASSEVTSFSSVSAL